MNEPLFKSAHEALTFAFQFSGQQAARSLMLQMAAPGAGGKGLGGLDGAAQAGMVRRELEECGKIAEAILTARFAPMTVPCSCKSPCCNGKMPNPEWSQAVTWLADHMRTTALAGTTARWAVRRECVVNYYLPKTQKYGAEEFAMRHGIHRESAGAYLRRVAEWLGGIPKKKDAEAVVGMEQMAINAVDGRLREIGMVG